MLTDLKARKMTPGEKAQRVGGVTGLYLRPGAKVGTGRFILRFISPETRKRRDMGLGTYPETRMAAARLKAMEARQLLEQLIDPIEQTRRLGASTVDAGRPGTFAEVSALVHADVASSFKNKKHREQWINTLSTYAWPIIGERPVDKLQTLDFANVLSPIWLSKPETASRVRQRCERVMTWCVAREMASTNPVSAVEALLPKQPAKRDRVQHHPSVPWQDLPSVCNELFGRSSISVGKHALLFAILTAGRSGEVRGAIWTEIDWQNSTWIIPGDRMKTRVRHRVPLSTQAMSLLECQAKFGDGNGWIFSRTGASPVSDMTMAKVLRDNRVHSDVDGRYATAHGFRSSFRDWASENGYARDLAEKSLAHTVRNQTEAAYHRTDLLEQRRGMMQTWSDFCMQQISARRTLI